MGFNKSEILTDKFYIKMSDEDKMFVSRQVTRYTRAFNTVYQNKELMLDPTFSNTIQTKYAISAKTYESLRADVEQQTKFFNENQKQIGVQVKQIKKLLTADRKKRRDPKETKHQKLSWNYRHKASKRIVAKEKQLKTDVCWGGKKLFRELEVLTLRLKSLDVTDKDYTETREKRYAKLLELRAARRHNLYLKGDAASKGSRFFDLRRLNEGVITYKPENHKERVNITFEIKSTKQQRKYDIIQNLINEKKIPITIRLNEDYICVSYDTSLVHNVKYDVDALRKKQKAVDLPTDEQKKIERDRLYIEHVRQHENNITEQKLKNRYAAIDVNPSGVGLCVMDKNDDGTHDIVAAECFDLSGIIKNGVSSNKRNFEIGNLYTKIFDICDHYKVSTFCVEDLDFKTDANEENNREFNRLTKNVWNLGLQTRLVKKHCVERGIIHREVNPTYTSIIGNLRYDYPDPICASVEIGRKGSVMYDKGSVALIRFQEHEVKAALKRRTKMDFDGSKLSNWKDVKKIADRSIRVGVSEYPTVRCSPLTSKRTNIIRQSMTEKTSPLICYV